MKAIINGNIVLPNGIIKGGAVVFNKKIEYVGTSPDLNSVDEITDANGDFVMPGFVDIHIHGYCGEDASDGKSGGLEKMSAELLKNGVTSFCPTTMTVEMSAIQKALDCIRELKAKTADAKSGARVLGANVEGPFINPQKKGAQSEEHILPPDAEFVVKNKDIIKLITLAPEMAGGEEFVKTVTEKTDVTVSLGHTSADYKAAKNAIKCGASHITHLFNAMPPLNHRNPGVIGAALEADSVTCEMICDTFHIHPALFEIVAKQKNDSLVLITDCMRAGGMPDGAYTLGGQKVVVNGIKCLLEDGTIAGSVLTMNRAVKNFAQNTSVPFWKAVLYASLVPAKVIGEDKNLGSLEKGKFADIITADENVNIKSVFVGGEKKF